MKSINDFDFWRWWKSLDKFGFQPIGAEEDAPRCQEPSQHHLLVVTSDIEVSDPFCVLDKNFLIDFDPESEEIELRGFLLIGKWVKGRRRGHGGLGGPRMAKNGIKYLTGNYKNGWLTGKGRVFLENGLVLEGEFQKGKLHGPVLARDPQGRLQMIGSFKNGSGCGPFWKRVEGDGFLYGSVDRKCGFTGEDNVFLYPDLSTAILGRFDSDELVRGQECDVAFVELENLVPILEVGRPKGPSFQFWPSTLTSILAPPLQEDPLEKKLVQVASSSIADAGEGLFARCRIPGGSTVAFYNGIRVKPGDTPPFRSINYEIYVDWQFAERGIESDYMDLPEDFISTQHYRATLGHKINHSFRPNCRWSVIKHPVFGRIPKIVTLRDIEDGEELTCHYMVDMKEAESNDNLKWYLDAWENQSNFSNPRFQARNFISDILNEIISNVLSKSERD